MLPLLRSAVLVMVAVLAGAAAPGAAQTAPAGAPVEVTALLPLTGPAAFLGASEIKSLRIIETLTNRAGGIHGRPLHFDVVDDQANPQVAVQLVNGVIAKRAPVFIGPGFSATCAAIAPLIEKAGPVGYCLSPAIHPPKGSYQFSASSSSTDTIVVLVRYLRLKGWNRIAIMTATDLTGQDFDRTIEPLVAQPENRGMTIVAHEHFAVGDVSVAAQIARIAAAKPQAVVVWTTGTALGTALHAIHDIGLEVPVATISSNMSYAQLQQYAGFLPADLEFAGLRAMTLDGTGPGPIHDAMTRYFNAFKATDTKTDFGTNFAWDPALIVVDALRTLGSDASADRIRDWIENLHGWVGINGLYDFRDGSQRGIGQNALMLFRWDPAKNDFVVVSRPGGYLH
jgi:branched-chain amino acid transport system substrate-binding protein